MLVHFVEVIASVQTSKTVSKTVETLGTYVNKREKYPINNTKVMRSHYVYIFRFVVYLKEALFTGMKRLLRKCGIQQVEILENSNKSWQKK